MSMRRTMKAQFIVGLVTAPLIFVTGLLLFWLVRQFVEFTPSVFFAIAIPFILTWAVLEFWLSKRSEKRWIEQQRGR